MLRCRCLQLCSVWEIKDRKNREGNLTIHEKAAYRLIKMRHAFHVVKYSEHSSAFQRCIALAWKINSINVVTFSVHGKIEQRMSTVLRIRLLGVMQRPRGPRIHAGALGLDSDSSLPKHWGKVVSIDILWLRNL